MSQASDTGFHLFDTAFGPCGIAWREGLVVATHLPEDSATATRDLLIRRIGGGTEAEPPAVVAAAITAITRHLETGRVNLSAIPCDFGDLDPFAVGVYTATRAIPSGETRSYGEIALALGDKRLAQAVGTALGRNPWPIIIPCHRVLGAGGKLTGFSAGGGIATKLRLLALEGAPIAAPPPLFGDLPLAVRRGR